MKLSTKGRYAMVALADIALQPADSLVSLGDISKRQDVSLPYLEQLFVKLRRGGLVESVRGPGGGYQLARAGDDIFVAQIINAVNESIDTTSCQGKGDCQGGDICLTHNLWHDLSERIHDFLNSISLADLVVRRDTQQIAQRQVDQLLMIDDNIQADAC